MPVLTIKQGQLRGRTDTARNGGSYHSFFAIPYAKPPLGDLRFKAPQPAESWTDVRDATVEGDECYSKHMIMQHPIGSEDCLFLNVFTQELPKNYCNLKPVMVWIHGGGFVAGSSKTEMYGPEFLMCEDVVVVSINYRLGVLGFLSLEDPSLGVPGNAGLKDMVMALKWVQENISKFNGDPNNVTIFGESAGGAAVHYLMLSPMAKNLFHKAIAQSGCALNLWAYGTQCGKELAGHLGCTSSDEKDILDTLQAASKEAILDAQYKLRDPFSANELRPHGPVVEKVSIFEPAFISDTPINIMQSGNYNKVPLLLGYNTREGLLFEIMEKRANTNEKITNFEKAVPNLLNLPEKSPMSVKIANLIKEFYYGNEEPTQANVDKYYTLQTDNFFLRGIYSTAKNILATSDTPVYFYRFCVESSLNVYKVFADVKAPGVCHADELGYMFKMSITPPVKSGSLEDITIKRLTKYWTNFARSGDPNPKSRDPLFSVIWTPAYKNALNFINIDENLTVGVEPEPERMKFWDSVYGMNPVTSKL